MKESASRRDVKFPATHRKVRARLANSVNRILVTIVLALLSLGWAQELNGISLAVNGAFLDEAGPYYFKSHGDERAYARSAPLAQALGLDVDYDDTAKVLLFSNGRSEARIRATGDVTIGLRISTDALSIDGNAGEPSSMAILVDGVSYVPLEPIVRAFGGLSEWHAQYHLISVTTADRLARILPPPRVGRHDGFTRVALDLPGTFQMAASPGSTTLIVTVPGADASNFQQTIADGFVDSVAYRVVDGSVGLVIEATHPLDPVAGLGYRFSVTEAGVFYVDLGPDLRGEAIAALATADTPPALPAPIVVIDAGHSSTFPGARGYAVEEEVALAIALRLKALLEARGVEVILTREGSSALGTHNQDDLMTRASYATPDRNLFVSIHANAHDNPSANGIETLVFGRPLNPNVIDIAIKENGGGDLGQALTDDMIASANDIAGNILRESQLNYSLDLAAIVQEHLIDATGAHDREIKQAPLIVLNQARTPAILVEVGFVSNPDEGPRLATSTYQDTLARALAEGIGAFLRGEAVANR